MICWDMSARVTDASSTVIGGRTPALGPPAAALAAAARTRVALRRFGRRAAQHVVRPGADGRDDDSNDDRSLHDDLFRRLKREG